ncbi:hypothetical protein [Actinocrinis sp.]|uniref:hypothetical protein n=1 Tax=Actinocrinis sp. TaxID=1920516 RepID=UPI002D699C79|nr:hypothetical protein [Actinocrinis sp.]HZP54441.1 hypothetical protein [Actinocrinis sp.]
MTLTEDQQADALRRLARAVANAEAAQAELVAAADHARGVGVSITRIAEVAKTSRDRVYGWLRKSTQANDTDG